MGFACIGSYRATLAFLSKKFLAQWAIFVSMIFPRPRDNCFPLLDGALQGFQRPSVHG